jgi:pyruvate/2-oxoglutarate dehydrogenase complex dihydrolipoamide acyltransferase (E2) component
MRIPVQMPQLGFDMPSGRIAGWVKQVGEAIAKGDVIAEVETEKTTVGMEALAAGTLVEIVRGAGDDVPIGEVIAWLEDEAPEPMRP